MLTKSFQELSKNDAAIAGGKGASLGEMTRARIPVPPGFVVLSESFERFIEETDLNVEIDNILHDVDPAKMHTVEHASETIQKLILEAKMPEDISEKIRENFKVLGTEYVAVRSSATAEDSDSAAWAGQLDSFLNTTEETLLQNVQRCWASLFTPRAIFYRFEKELHNTKISVAVVVQKMVESEVSGIAFSVHPVTEDRNQLIIEAGYGLGEAIVSGQITPDSYVVEKEPRRIIDKNIADQERGIYRSAFVIPSTPSVIPAEAGIQEEKESANEWRSIPSDRRFLQKLSDEQILELSDLIVKIENHYGFPCDIEWAYENGKFYIVQSRPITTLSSSDVLLKSERIKALVNTFSREKKLYYFDLWDYCDKEGVRKYFGKRMENSLFIVPPKGQKGSVWHESEEISELKSVAVEVFQEFGAGSVWERVKTDAHKAWNFLKPYAEGKDITDIEEWKTYQEHLLLFWTAMNSVTWEAIDDPKTPKQVRDDFIALREASERFVERTSALATDFFENTVSSWSSLSHVLTFAEMVAIAEKRSVDKDEISKRTKGCFLFRGTVHASLNQLEEILRGSGLRQERVYQEDIEQIKGVSAFKGTVSGHAKLVNGKEELSKVADGDILVTQMTSPDYVPAIKKAGAVVTDEGGSLCHAAIVSRELKKPCIIGTKIAMQVLHDGDLVEVDADNGVVRVLERGKDDAKNKVADLSHAGHTWFMTITRNMSFWHQCLSNEGHFRHTKDFGVDAELRILQITKEGTETSIFMHNPNYAEYSEAVIEAVGTGEAIANLKERYFELAEKLVSALDNAKQSLSGSSFVAFLDEYRRFAAGLMITATLGRAGAEKLTARLNELGYKDEQISEINAVVTYPKEHTPLFNSQLDLLKIGISVQDGKSKEEIDEALSEWLQKYGYIPVNFCEDPWTIDDAKKQLEDFSQKNCREEYPLVKKSHSERVKKAGDLLDKIGDKEVSILAHAIAEGTYLNEFRKNIFSKISLEYRDIFDKIALKGGSSNWRDCFYLTPGEMLDIISGESISISDLKKERRIAGVCVDEKGELVLLDKETTNKFYDHITKAHGAALESSTVGEVIKGASANKGIIRGIVKVVLGSKDFHKLNIGEILVTTMTSVDFVPVMGKASAFVTNEGGITSHASIVAREMNKPCIIGTKTATQVLHDGDLVEVDAERGVVRILERLESVSSKADYQGEKWVQKWARGMKIQKAEDYSFAVGKPFEDLFGIGFWNWMYVSRDNTSEVLIKNGEWENFLRFFEKKFREDSSFYSLLYPHFESLYNPHVEFLSKATPEQLLDLSDEEFLAKYREYKESLRKFYAPMWLAPLVESIVENVLYEVLRKYVGTDSGEIERAVKIVSSISKPNYLVQEELDLIRISQLEKEKQSNEIKNHTRQFAYISMYDYDHTPNEEEFFRSRLAELDDSKTRNAVLEKRSEFEKNEKELSRLLNELKPDEFDRLRLEAIHEFIYQKDQRSHYRSMDAYLGRMYYSEISRRIGVSLADLMYLTDQEITDWVLSDKQTDLLPRKKFYAFISSDGTCDVLSGDDGMRYFDENVLNDTSEDIRGLGVTRGIVRGRVRVILHPDEIGTVLQGEILITTMTRPDYVIAMKRCGAVVTDEGGMLCHAAIVSRELGLPCVVGTKVATKILHDGDLVEVDADNGVVRVLERGKG